MCVGNKMWPRIALLALLLHVVAALKTDCPRPCIPIDKCPDLVKLIRTNVRVVQEATCGFQGPTPVVCCPVPSREKLISNSTPITTINVTEPTPPIPNPLLPKNCGHFSEDDRVIGGNQTRLGNFPWMAGLGYRNSFTSEIEFLCGGSVINERYILTAAHCLDRQLAVVRLAEWDLTSEIDCETGTNGFEFCNPNPAQDFEYEELIKHPDYRQRGHVSDDIALVRLSRPIRFSQWIQPVCLPDRDFDVPSVLGERQAIVTGWGFTENGTTSDILLQVSLPLGDTAQCNTTYKGILVGNQLCFGGIKGKDSCGGDSGGPLMISAFRAPPYTQIGIVSYGPTPCAKKDVPGVYANVAKYRDWIDETIRP